MYVSNLSNYVIVIGNPENAVQAIMVNKGSHFLRVELRTAKFERIKIHVVLM